MFYDFALYDCINLFDEIINKTQNLQHFTKFIFFLRLMNEIRKNFNYFLNRTILIMHNHIVAKLNDLILNFLLKNTHTMIFVNFITNEFRINKIFIKNLRFLKIFSLFFDILRLKIEISIILLRNLYFKKNFCNDICLIVTNIRKFVLKIQIFDDNINEQIRFILKIVINNFSNDLF